MSFETSDRDYGHYLLGEDIDIEAQLRAIRVLLHRQRADEEATAREIREIETEAGEASGEWAQHLVDLRSDELHGSVYQDAAHSAAAAGMLAPLLETIFTRAFLEIEKRRWPQADMTRLDRARDHGENPWLARHYFSSSGEVKTDIVRGAGQLATMTGLDKELPEGFCDAFEALITYRNRMLHSGFEWPVDDREKFETRIELRKWQAWFSSARTGGRPWSFYMTEAFIARCLNLVDELLEALGRLVRARFAVNGWDAPAADAEADEGASTT